MESQIGLEPLFDCFSLPELPPAVKKRPVTPALSSPHRRRSTRSRSSAASRHRSRTPRRSPSRSRERSRTPRRSPSRRRRRAKVSPRRSRSPRRTPQRSRTPKRSRSRSRSRSARRRSPSRRRDSTSKDKRSRLLFNIKKGKKIAVFREAQVPLLCAVRSQKNAQLFRASSGQRNQIGGQKREENSYGG